MSTEIPRLRMFAGPNGSGKSTLKTIIGSELIGIYVNADEIEKSIGSSGELDFNCYRINVCQTELVDFFAQSSLAGKSSSVVGVKSLLIESNKLFINSGENNSYFCSIVSDFIRQKLIKDSKSFTFETVMSFPDKIDLLRQAQSRGYRTYLYYVATEDPAINISRVQYRVSIGGHPVPDDKVVSRYYRSLDLLADAVKATNRSYLFDNSGSKQIWLAEITDGHLIEIKTDKIPVWFAMHLWDKFGS